MTRRPCQLAARLPEMVANLLRLYRQQTLPSDVASGLAWYPDARRIVREWSATYDLPVRTVACVISALSPQNEWTRNLIQADDILAGRPVSIGALRVNVDKAQRIARHRATDISVYFKSGPKVQNFAENLAGSVHHVTVDTHCLQAALDDVQSTLCLKSLPYTFIASAYIEAAREVGYTPADFQAVIWHTWKRLYPRMTKHAQRRRW